MNILEEYDPLLVCLGEPETSDNENYFCALSYQDSPFIIQTNRICYSFKEKSNVLYVSLASQEYALWVESLYKQCVDLIYHKTSEWFEEELSQLDIEHSFLSPLKSNIQKGCYDILCTIEPKKLILVDKLGRNIKSDLKNYKIVPTIHIKGIKFNSKHFMLDLVLTSVIILEEYHGEESEIENTEENLAEWVEPVAENPELFELKLDDIQPDEEVNLPMPENEFARVYSFLEKKIHDDVLEHLTHIFTKKRIKVNIDLSELFEEEVESD